MWISRNRDARGMALGVAPRAGMALFGAAEAHRERVKPL